jgi:hypothetical protein
VPKRSMKTALPNFKSARMLKEVADCEITGNPWKILTRCIPQNGPYTSQDLLCFDEIMKGSKKYNEKLITDVKTKMSRSYGEGIGTSFSKDFPELCQEPHCWPRECILKPLDWVGFKTVHLKKKLTEDEQALEWWDSQYYGWKVLEGFLGREGPYKSEDLKQFEKWMKETKLYHNYIIWEIKSLLIKCYALGTNQTFTKDFPELCQGTNIWNTNVPEPNENDQYGPKVKTAKIKFRIKCQVPKKSMKTTLANFKSARMLNEVADWEITSNPWKILTQCIPQNGPYTSQDLLCFEEIMKGSKKYNEKLIADVKTKMSRSYGEGIGTSFSKDFPELCQKPHCWPRERKLKPLEWVGFPTLLLSYRTLYEQKLDWWDMQVYGWKVLEGFLGREGPYKSEDLVQFEKWMKETKLYHNYIICEIKNELIQRYALGTKRTFTNDFPELCQGTDIWPVPNRRI